MNIIFVRDYKQKEAITVYKRAIIRVDYLKPEFISGRKLLVQQVRTGIIKYIIAKAGSGIYPYSEEIISQAAKPHIAHSISRVEIIIVRVPQ